MGTWPKLVNTYPLKHDSSINVFTRIVSDHILASGQIVDKFRPDPLPFGAITHEDDAHSKPASDPYLAAITRCELPTDQCLGIEDAPRGLQAAQAAALDCWVIPTELTLTATFAGATRVLEPITHIPRLLLPARSR
jgi:beta-phosphoglucomutase-like phosphatase (HAD superfamily)